MRPIGPCQSIDEAKARPPLPPHHDSGIGSDSGSTNGVGGSAHPPKTYTSPCDQQACC